MKTPFFIVKSHFFCVEPVIIIKIIIKKQKIRPLIYLNSGEAADLTALASQARNCKTILSHRGFFFFFFFFFLIIHIKKCDCHPATATATLPLPHCHCQAASVKQPVS
jgi:hypothetical protein